MKVVVEHEEWIYHFTINGTGHIGTEGMAVPRTGYTIPIKVTLSDARKWLKEGKFIELRFEKKVPQRQEEQKAVVLSLMEIRPRLTRIGSKIREIYELRKKIREIHELRTRNISLEGEVIALKNILEMEIADNEKLEEEVKKLKCSVKLLEKDSNIYK